VLERDPKKNAKKYCVWKASGSILHRFWDPTWIREGGSANAVLDVFCGLGAVLGGRWPQDAPRALPRPILDRFWTDFGQFFAIFHRFFDALAAVSSCVKARAGH